MKLPYGISNFKKIRFGNYLYIDKTKFVEKIENLNSEYVFFIRPRRFGKSLFLSILENYYDISAKEDFDKLFGNLYIGQNPTPLRNSYLILHLDFSALNTDSKEGLINSFKSRLIGEINNFLVKYQEHIKEVIIPENSLDISSDVATIIKSLIDVLIKCNQKLYLIIDEYDHFANDIIAMGESSFYKDIIRASGFIRDFYEAVKIGTKNVIDRIFITGASPVMLDDLTSGFNIAANVTTNATLNEMLGFTEAEVKTIINNVDINKDKENLVKELKSNYNGYLFDINGSQRVYNPDMVLYFFKEWKDTGHYPQQLIDDNVKTDYGRLERLARNEDNRVLLERIIEEESITTNITTKFSFDRMYDKDYFESLLFYMGLLTIKGEKYGKLELIIPNYVIRTLFWEYFEKSIRERHSIKYDTRRLDELIWNIAGKGTIRPFIEFVADNVLKQLSNRDLIGFNEKYIKILLFAYLVNSNIYKPVSEQEVENGYIDIYLKREEKFKEAKYDWIIELKYVKECDRGKLAQIKQDGLQQLDRYAVSRGVVDREDVRKALVVFIGKNDFDVVE